MKRLPQIPRVILALACCGVAGWFGPWWAPAAFLAAWTILMRTPRRTAVIEGGLILAAVFGAVAGWMFLRDESDLLGKTGALLGGLPAWALLLVTIVIGWITGLLAGWLGSALGVVIMEKNDTP
jgi:hypothetical protein